MAKETEKTELVSKPVKSISCGTMFKAAGGQKPTVKTCVGRIAADIESIRQQVDTRTGETRNCFVGTFVGETSTGEVIDSNTLYLPDYFSKSLEADVKEKGRIEVGLLVFVEPSKSGAGYTYTVEAPNRPRVVRQNMRALFPALPK